MNTLKVKRLCEGAVMPAYAHPGDAGLDLYSVVAVSLGPGERKLIATGISIRSGLALKHGITVLNAPGTIDYGYRGEVGVMLINHGQTTFDVQPGMKIAQLVVAPCLTVEVTEASDLPDSSRGQGGFGSTGT